MLKDAARDHIEKAVADLRGEDDFRPFMMILRPSGDVAYVGMDMPEERKKHALTDAMTEIVAAYRATEVVFCTVLSTATGKTWGGDPQAWGIDPHMPPSEHPAARVVMMLHMTRDGGVEVVYTAPLVREDHKASLGQYASCTWPRCWPCRSMIGSPLVWFSAALRRGMRLGAKVTAAEEIQTDLEQKGLL